MFVQSMPRIQVGIAMEVEEGGKDVLNYWEEKKGKERKCFEKYPTLL